MRSHQALNIAIDRVHQPDIGVHGGDHRLAGDFGIAVGDGDGGFLVQAEQHLRLGIAEIIDDRVMQPAIARARGERDIGNIERAQRLGDDVRAEARRIGAGRRRTFDRGNGGIGIGGASGRGLGRRHGGHFLLIRLGGVGRATSNRIMSLCATGREVPRRHSCPPFDAGFARRQRPSLMCGLNHHGLSQFFGETIEAAGEAVDIEIERIVVAVGNFGIDGGVKRRNEPFAFAHAGDGVEQSQPVILRGSERRIGGMSVTAASALAGLDELDMDEQALQGAAKFRRLLEFGLAPRNCEFVVEDHLTDTVDDDMRFAPAVGAGEVLQIVERRAFLIDVVGKAVPAERRAAGIVNHKIARHRGVGIIVVRARQRLPQMSGKIGFEILRGEIAGQCFARRQAGGLADAAGKTRGQRLQRRTEVARRIHAAHQTHRLLDRRASVAQGLGIERASAHALDEKWCPEMARLALVA